MATKPKASAKAEPIKFTDPRTGEEYLGCGLLINADQMCHRYAGHTKSHRVHLYKSDDPEVQAKRAKRAERAAAFAALSPEEQEAVKAEKAARFAEQKAKWAADRARNGKAGAKSASKAKPRATRRRAATGAAQAVSA